MINLTEQQFKIFDVIKGHVNDYGYPPTRAEIAKIWNPPASMHNKPTNVFANENKQISSSTARSSRGNLYKNDERLYGGGGYKGTEVDTRNFTSGYYEQKEFRESFSKNTSVAAKAPF